VGTANSKKKVSYVRQSNTRWSLNGLLSPSRATLISHLRNEHGILWDLESLSYAELLAIHDDDHNGRLGAFEVAFLFPTKMNILHIKTRRNIYNC
jgi:hypothetical protein